MIVALTLAILVSSSGSVTLGDDCFKRPQECAEQLTRAQDLADRAITRAENLTDELALVNRRLRRSEIEVRRLTTSLATVPDESPSVWPYLVTTVLAVAIGALAYHVIDQ